MDQTIDWYWLIEWLFDCLIDPGGLRLNQEDWNEYLVLLIYLLRGFHGTKSSWYWRTSNGTQGRWRFKDRWVYQQQLFLPINLHVTYCYQMKVTFLSLGLDLNLGPPDCKSNSGNLFFIWSHRNVSAAGFCRVNGHLLCSENRNHTKVALTQSLTSCQWIVKIH